MINISKLYCGLAGESDYLRYSEANRFGPVIVYNCTVRCNLRCLHCYSASQYDRADVELTTAEAKRMLAGLAEANCPVVLFSGGEPLLRSDVFELLAEAKRLGMRTVISTNGTLIDADTAKKLADAGLGYAGISLDGHQQFHDKFRRVAGAFKAALMAIENCRNAGIKTGLRFTITKANADQVPAVFDIAASEGVRRICYYHLIRTGRAKALAGQVPSAEQTRSVVDTIIEKTDEAVQKDSVDEVLTVGNHADGPYLLVRMERQNSEHYEKAKRLLMTNGGNKTGEKIGCVSWAGDVHPDQFWMNYSLGNVKEKSFGQIWHNSAEPVLSKLRNKSQFAESRCLGCRWFELCRANYRFLGSDPAVESWRNEPACYLTDDEISE